MHAYTPRRRSGAPLAPAAPFPARPARALVALASLLAALLALAACGGDAEGQSEGVTGPSAQAGSPLPASVVGAWISGSVSSVNFFNPNTGSWAAPSGTGLYYRFASDGRFEKGALLQSSLYGCTMSVSFYESGTVRLDGEAMHLRTTYTRMKSVDNCVAKNNYERAFDAEPETLYAQRGRDQYGNDVLWIRSSTATATAFRPAQ